MIEFKQGTFSNAECTCPRFRMSLPGEPKTYERADSVKCRVHNPVSDWWGLACWQNSKGKCLEEDCPVHSRSAIFCDHDNKSYCLFVGHHCPVCGRENK